MPDARVQAAIEHWAPRFVQAGVDYSDFAATTAGVERWEDWLDAWCRNGRHARRARRGGRGERAARSRPARPGRARPSCYHFAKFVWMVDAEPQPRSRRPGGCRDVRRRTSQLDPTPSGSRCRSTAAAWWATCAVRRGGERPPLVLLLPGLDSTKEEFFRSRTSSSTAGWRRCRSTGRARASRATTCRSGPTTRSPSTAVLDAIAGRDDVDLDRVGAARGEPGRLLRAARRRSSRASRRASGVSGPYNFGDIWDTLPAADARDVRGQVVRRATTRRGASEGLGARPERRGRAHPAALPGDHRAGSTG